MTANKPSPFHAVLGNIEVEGVNTDRKEKRSWYSVRLYVAKKEVLKSTKKPASSVLTWEWTADNQIRFEPSSVIKIVLYRGFEANITFDHFVGQHEGNSADLLEKDTSFVLKDKKGTLLSVKMKIALSPVTISTPQSNRYLALGGPSGVVVDPETGVQQAKAVGEVVYEGLKAVVDGLYECSDMFLPLKTAAGVFRTITKFVEAVLDNKQELKNLEAKLGIILLIVEKYKKGGGVDAITRRVEDFSKAITVHLEAVKTLQEQSLVTRAAFAQKDADTILKALRNIISLCDIFQIDTQLNIDITVGKVLEYMNSGLIDKLNHEMTSYKTRTSSYGDPTGCMEGTRVKVLEDLNTWASDANGSKVYWMVGMAGVGKSTIAHTFCQILEAKNMLSGSFFASRASDKTSNARLIIPVIAHALSRSSPPIKFKVVKAIEDDSTLAEPTYSNMREQFKQLVYDPIQATASIPNKPYKVVVIDAVDECVNLEVVASFIKLVLQSASKMPLKVFISSRQELEISDAFSSGSWNSKVENLRLHDIEKDVVLQDIRKYLETSLASIRDKNSQGTAEAWPSKSELEDLIARCGTLFIYAATATRYIASGGRRYKSRLSEMAHRGLESVTEFKTNIDTLYIHILEMACKEKPSHEVAALRDVVSIIVFLRSPLPIQAIESLSEIDASSELSQLASVIHLPEAKEAVVAPFHASFPDFITSPIRCSPERSPFRALDPSEGHKLLALKCLKLMNWSLKYNICEIPEELTWSHRERTNSPANVGKISGAVKYSCVYWAAHLAEVKEFDDELTHALRIFLHEHFLHWVECLSLLGELQTGLKSLDSVAPVLLSCGYHDIRLFVDDACRCIKMSFEAVQKHCMEIYQSALVWIPKKSLVRQVYDAHVRKVPKVLVGLANLWGTTELVLQNVSSVSSVAFSPDGTQIVSGSHDKTVRVWNTTTGEVEAELDGHTSSVSSVAFSQDGSRVVSGSEDKAVRVWNTTTGEVEAELEGHTSSVSSVAFSQDGSRVVSGSHDKTVRVWNTTTGEVEAELEGHTSAVSSVAFSQDGSRVVSGSHDETVRVWNTTTGKVEAELEGHTSSVSSVAFSPDGSQVVSGSYDRTVRVWNTTTGKVAAELEGHTGFVYSVAFSPDGSRVVSGSHDKTVRVWNTTTGEVEAELDGHTSSVYSVAFSQDGSRVVSGSPDKTVRVWNTTTGKVAAELDGHTSSVSSVAFSQDGSRVVSGSHDKTIRVWNTTTGEVEAELQGHTGSVYSVAFSPDGSRVVSGSEDKTVRVWNTTTGEVEAELKGHTDWVTSVAFSQDGSRVVSGSEYQTVRIWDVMTGRSQSMTTADLKLPDGSRVMRTTSEEFSIFYPSQHPTPSISSSLPIISDNNQWIMAGFCHCWIPSQYRGISCSSNWGGQVICFGLSSGHIIVLDMTRYL